ncbi:MAG: hypothetical protein AAF982_03930 [Pseudomonadota bacterium]
MIIKIVSLFLVFIIALAMFGKLKAPGGALRRKLGLDRPKTCPYCGQFVVGKDPCSCGKGTG